MKTMKKTIILLLTVLISTFVFAQDFEPNASNWNNTSFDEKDLQSQLKIYPNPCTGEFLTLDFSSNKISEITISNIAGKEILKTKINFPESTYRLQINDVPNGIYLAKIKTVSNKSVVKKIVVSKQ